MIRKLRKKNKEYTITFDRRGILDTVECDGSLLVSTKPVVRQLLNNADAIRDGALPKGFEKVR